MKPLLIIVLLAIMASLSGQNLLSSRQSGYYTYVFRISDREAKKIYKTRNDNWMKKDGYFRTLVDSFPTYTEYAGKLKPGHYLKVSVKNNRIEASINSVLNVNVQVVNNNTDLCIQLYDTTGALVKDARVRVEGMSVKYGNAIKGFLLKRADIKGIVEVKYNGVTSFFGDNKRS